MKPGRVTGARLCVCGGQVVPGPPAHLPDLHTGAVHERRAGRDCRLQEWASHFVKEVMSHLKRLYSLNTPHSILPLTGAGTDPTLESRKPFSNPHLSSFSRLPPKYVENPFNQVPQVPPPTSPCRACRSGPSRPASHPNPLAAGTTAWHFLGPGLSKESVCLRFPLRS